MGDAFSGEPKGAFGSFLDWIDKPGQVVRNSLQGNFSGALKNLGDFALDPFDAILPGDLIPELAGEQDKVSGSDLIGLDKEAHPFLGFLGDVGVGTLTDPLTYLTFGASAGLKGLGTAAKVGLPFTKIAKEIPGSAKAIQGAGKLAKAGFEQLPDVAQGKVKDVGHGIRKTFAALKPNKAVAAAEQAAIAHGGVTRQAAQQFPVDAFAGIDPLTQKRAVETLRGVSSEGQLGPAFGYEDLGIAPAGKFGTKSDQMALIDQRLAKMPWPDAEKEAVRQATDKISDYTRAQWDQGIGDQVFALPPDIGATSKIATRQLEQAPLDYFPGMTSLDEQVMTPAKQVSALASMLKAKTYTNPTELAEGLSATGKKLDTNVPKVLGQYGEQMGRAAQSAKLGAQYLGPQQWAKGANTGFKALTDPDSRSAMEAAVTGLREAGDLDSAHVLETAWKGTPKPGKFVEILGKLNKPFKAAATGGILIPRLNFTVGNVTSSFWQAFSNKEARGVALKTLARAIPTIFGSIGDGLRQLGIHAIPESKAALVTKAARESGGTREGMLSRITDKRLRSAVEHNVLDGGFVGAEEMLAKDEAHGKGLRSLDNWLYWPQAIAKAAEQRMRYGMFDDLVSAGKSEVDAARIANETLLDYRIASTENRALRGGFPFAQFISKSVPQQAKFLAEQPSIAVALSQAYGAHENPVYPYMDKSLNIGVGHDEQGNDQYLSSLRMPFEVLGQIPNPSGSLSEFGEDLRQDVGGMAHPLLKSLFGLVSGEDATFGTKYGSFSKLPGNIEGGEVGRAYNKLAGTGLIQPLASVAQTAGKFIDDRTSPAEKALSLLTGFRVQSVDPDRALRQQLQKLLENSSEIQQHQSFYSKDPDVQELLNAYQAAQQRVKAKRPK